MLRVSLSASDIICTTTVKSPRQTIRHLPEPLLEKEFLEKERIKKIPFLKIVQVELF